MEVLKAVRDANASTTTSQHPAPPGLERLERKFDALKVDLEGLLTSIHHSFLSQIPALIKSFQSATSCPEPAAHSDVRGPTSASVFHQNPEEVPTVPPPTEKASTPPPVTPTMPTTPPPLLPTGTPDAYISGSPPPPPALSPRSSPTLPVSPPSPTIFISSKPIPQVPKPATKPKTSLLGAPPPAQGSFPAFAHESHPKRRTSPKSLLGAPPISRRIIGKAATLSNTFVRIHGAPSLIKRKNEKKEIRRPKKETRRPRKDIRRTTIVSDLVDIPSSGPQPKHKSDTNPSARNLMDDSINEIDLVGDSFGDSPSELNQ